MLSGWHIALARSLSVNEPGELNLWHSSALAMEEAVSFHDHCYLRLAEAVMTQDIPDFFAFKHQTNARYVDRHAHHSTKFYSLDSLERL